MGRKGSAPRLVCCGDCDQERPVCARELCARCYHRRQRRQQWTGPPPQTRIYGLNAPCVDCGGVSGKRIRGRCNGCYQKGIARGTFPDLVARDPCSECGRQKPYLHSGGVCDGCYRALRRLRGRVLVVFVWGAGWSVRGRV